MTKETFNVGDVVYDKTRQRLEVIGFGVRVKSVRNIVFYRPYEELTHQKPLKEITEKELAEMGFVLKK